MKMTHKYLSNSIHVLASCFALLLTSVAHAQLAFRFSINTTPLVSSPAGPFYLNFQLNDGSGFGNGDSSAYISNFNFGGGNAFGLADGQGAFSGNLTSSIWLNDGSFINEFYQAFMPGSFLQFDVVLNSTSTDPIPDSFAFAILDSTLSNLPTLSGGSDAFAQIDFSGSLSAVNTYASDMTIPPAAGGSPINVSAPSITPVPEPSTYGIIGALALLAVVAHRRRMIGKK